VRLTPLLLTALPLAVLPGCADRSGTAVVEIVNDQSALGGRAEPILVAPGVDVVENEYRRAHQNEGSNIRQRIVIRGPVMIVPAPATRPAQ
jgi:hypothetical protein